MLLVSHHKTDHHDIAEILLKVALNTITIIQMLLFNAHYITLQTTNYNLGIIH